MCDRVNEVVETIGHRHIDICRMQESHWKDCSARLILAKGFNYKLIWSDDNSGFRGVGVLLNKNWIDKVISVVRLTLVVSNIFSVSAPQTGLSMDEKDSFYYSVISQLSHLMSIC